MKKIMILALACMVVLAAASAFAVGPGKTVEYTPKGTGKVVFDGKAHAKAKCNECHPAVFKMKKGSAAMTMKDMAAGKYCGVCHNGTKAFGVKDAAQCGKCHK
jgi:c(7)-type cytochrome triheme protein